MNRDSFGGSVFSRRMRRLVLCSSLLALVLAMAGPSHAQSPQVLASTYPPHGGPGGAGVEGTEAADDVTVQFVVAPRAYETGQYTVSDPAGVTPGANCSSIEPAVVACTSFGGPITPDKFSALLYGGDDRFVFRGNRHNAAIYAGTGSDRILGGRSRNVLFGEEGGDQLLGRDGNDLIDGGPQRDELDGGPGNDRIDAADGERDLLIDCGPGDDDIVRLDTDLDPAPIHCEKVRGPSELDEPTPPRV